MRTKNDHISIATDVVMASFHVIAPKGPGFLWEALKNSKSVEKALKTDENYSDTKYLPGLADAYDHATTSCWDTRRQVLSVMADLVPYHVIQQHIIAYSAAHECTCCNSMLDTQYPFNFIKGYS